MAKVILITGASAGIGKEAAKLLVAKGHTVYGAARRMDKMQDLKAAGVKTARDGCDNRRIYGKGCQ